MYLPDISGDRYVTDPRRFQRYSRRRIFKGPFWFYFRYALLVLWSGTKFTFTRDPQKAVILQALRVMRIVEKQGAHLTFEGLDGIDPESRRFHRGSRPVSGRGRSLCICL